MLWYETEAQYYDRLWRADNDRAARDRAWLSGAYEYVEDTPDVAADAAAVAGDLARGECARRADNAEAAYIAAHAAEYAEYADAWAYLAWDVPVSAISPVMVARRLRATARMRETDAGRVAAGNAAYAETDAALRRVARAAEAYTLARLRGRGRYVLAVVVERGAQAA